MILNQQDLYLRSYIVICVRTNYKLKYKLTKMFITKAFCFSTSDLLRGLSIGLNEDFYLQYIDYWKISHIKKIIKFYTLKLFNDFFKHFFLCFVSKCLSFLSFLLIVINLNFFVIFLKCVITWLIWFYNILTTYEKYPCCLGLQSWTRGRSRLCFC